MPGESDAGIVTSLQDSLDFRIETLQAVLMGQMSPLDRRLELAGRRPGIVFGATGSPLVGSLLENEADQSSSDEGPGQDPSGFETADSVEIKVESPSEDELRVANFLAEKHSDAESIALTSEDTVKVREASGGTFSVDVTDVLEREFGENSDTGTQDASIPSMSTAAA